MVWALFPPTLAFISIIATIVHVYIQEIINKASKLKVQKYISAVKSVWGDGMTVFQFVFDARLKVANPHDAKEKIAHPKWMNITRSKIVSQTPNTLFSNDGFSQSPLINLQTSHSV